MIDQARDDLTDHDLARSGCLLESGGDPDGVARDEALPRVGRRRDHLARGDPDSDLEPDAVLGCEPLAESRHSGLDLERGPSGTQRVVLVRHGDAERSHDRVPGELLDRASVTHQRGGNRVEVPAQDLAERLGVQRVRQRHRLDDVAEEDRRQPAELHCRHRRFHVGKERLVLAQDRGLELLEAGPRLHPELLDQGVAGGAVGPERVRLPARAVEREHELRARPLAQRLRVDDGLQLGHELDVAAEREIGVDPFLQRHESKLLEPRDLCLREGLVGEVGERRPAPERERLAESRRRTRCIPGGQALPAFVCEPREAVHVHSRRIELEHVAGRAPGDRLRPERLTQLRDVHLHRVRGRVWRLARPEDLDQLIDGDDAARLERQCCQ